MEFCLTQVKIEVLAMAFAKGSYCYNFSEICNSLLAPPTSITTSQQDKTVFYKSLSFSLNKKHALKSFYGGIKFSSRRHTTLIAGCLPHLSS